MSRFLRFSSALTVALGLGHGIPTAESSAWKPHIIRQGNGQGGWLCKPARNQFLNVPAEGKPKPIAFGGGAGAAHGFGLAQMDTGEVVLVGTWHPQDKPEEETVIAFSRDRGTTWTDLKVIPGLLGRPMNLTYHGGSLLSFLSDRRYFSHDYGHTWSESIEHQLTKEGMAFNVEGNAWVDRDPSGRAKAILEIGWHYGAGKHHPVDDATAVFRRSTDGGRTWVDEVAPPEWKSRVTADGKTYVRGVSEGAIVRADNGWLVAALRTDMPPRYFKQPNSDHYEGTGVSISKDDGKTWSRVNRLYDAGRMHANLLKLPNGDLVMTMTVRQDIQNGRLTTYRRGCEAVVSHDHGITWDLARKYVLDEWQFFDQANPHIGPCGHLYSILLDDGSILTLHNNYLVKSISVIRWHP